MGNLLANLLVVTICFGSLELTLFLVKIVFVYVFVVCNHL